MIHLQGGEHGVIKYDTTIKSGAKLDQPYITMGIEWIVPEKILLTEWIEFSYFPVLAHPV
jgi:hypothetical protein